MQRCGTPTFSRDINLLFLHYPPFDLYKDEFSDLVKQIEERLHAEQEDASDLLSECKSLLPQMVWLIHIWLINASVT
jgi:hypothetical protein